jgi:hypothetical protein
MKTANSADLFDAIISPMSSTMKLVRLLPFVVPMVGSLASAVTEDQVMKCLQSVTLASNAGKVDGVLETMPAGGFELVFTETKQRRHFDRAQMRK